MKSICDFDNNSFGSSIRGHTQFRIQIQIQIYIDTYIYMIQSRWRSKTQTRGDGGVAILCVGDRPEQSRAGGRAVDWLVDRSVGLSIVGWCNRSIIYLVVWYSAGQAIVWFVLFFFTWDSFFFLLWVVRSREKREREREKIVHLVKKVKSV